MTSYFLAIPEVTPEKILSLRVPPGCILHTTKESALIASRFNVR